MCGIIGTAAKKENVIPSLMLGLNDLQHRGEQACGFATSNGSSFRHHAETGLVTEVFNEGDRGQLFEKMAGNLGIGHVLYSTVGRSGEKKQPRTLQPLVGDFHGTPFALGHNGNLVGLGTLREEAKLAGYTFKSEASDTEVIVALLSISKEADFIKALESVLPKLKGAFALIILYKDKVIGVRDRNGIRPLCIGYNSSSYVLASESCPFFSLNINFIRELRPGEVVVLDQYGIQTNFLWTGDAKLRFSIFELVYFARPDSIMLGKSVWSYRDAAGTITAQEHSASADVVMYVPESGKIYGEAYATGVKVPFKQGLFRGRYHTTRSFLTARETDRRGLQRIKIHPLKDVIRGNRVVIVEDSLVRGSVIPETVGMIREAGATEVHVRVCSAPVCSTCHLGIDMADLKDLPAASLSVPDINKIVVRAESLGYLSFEKMVAATGVPAENLCLGCFNGDYPVPS